MSIRESDLVGGWDLVSWINNSPGDAELAHPFGEDASGQLQYTADGRMSVVIHRTQRSRLSSLIDRLAPEPEQASAFASYYHYAGTWQVDGDTIIHEIHHSLTERLVGTKQTRWAFLDGNELTLTASEPAGGGKVRTGTLVWRRAIRTK